MMVKDSQVVEVLGKNFLVNQLLQAGIGVAVPVRDNGVDLIAYLNKEQLRGGYAARPIQIKASSGRAFSLDKKYQKFPHLVIVFIWHLDQPRTIVAYGLDYQDAVTIADRMGYTKTPSWQRGKYATSNPSERLISLLGPYKMNANRWKSVLREY